MSQVRAAVVVLGDLGRSPRMQYHARSLADQGALVDLIGCEGAEVWAPLLQHPRVHIHQLEDRLSAGRTALHPWSRGLRMGRLGIALLARLLSLPRPNVILVQNPPAIPTLSAALLAARFTGARLVVDWHNFGYSVLERSAGGLGPLLHWAERHERWCGRHAWAHLCVSRGMAEELTQHWGIEPRVLYDEPVEQFSRQTAAAAGAAAARLRSLGIELGHPSSTEHDDPSRARLLNGGPALFVSSTSWTEDEDLDLLLEAAHALDERIARQPDRFPEVNIVITGKGPRRAGFERRLRARCPKHVHLSLAWLPFEDYACLLGVADLGLCLHRSTSGWDLPMKVSDMLGAGLPVAALDYGPTLGEKLRHGENALLFRDAPELAGELAALLCDVSRGNDGLFRLQQRVRECRPLGWNEGWERCAKPLLFGTPA